MTDFIDRMLTALGSVYIIGIPLHWTWLIAWGFSKEVNYGFAMVLVGWVISVFWPMHILVLAWLNFWF